MTVAQKATVDNSQSLMWDNTFYTTKIELADGVEVKAGTLLAYGAADGNVAPAIKGTREAQFVVNYDITAPAAGGPHTIPCSVADSGSVARDLLILQADGDASNIDDSVLKPLRAGGFVVEDVNRSYKPDNGFTA